MQSLAEAAVQKPEDKRVSEVPHDSPPVERKKERKDSKDAKEHKDFAERLQAVENKAVGMKARFADLPSELSLLSMEWLTTEDLDSLSLVSHESRVLAHKTHFMQKFYLPEALALQWRKNHPEAKTWKQAYQIAMSQSLSRQQKEIVEELEDMRGALWPVISITGESAAAVFRARDGLSYTHIQAMERMVLRHPDASYPLSAALNVLAQCDEIQALGIGCGLTFKEVRDLHTRDELRAYIFKRLDIPSEKQASITEQELPYLLDMQRVFGAAFDLEETRNLLCKLLRNWHSGGQWRLYLIIAGIAPDVALGLNEPQARTYYFLHRHGISLEAVQAHVDYTRTYDLHLYALYYLRVIKKMTPEAAIAALDEFMRTHGREKMRAFHALWRYGVTSDALKSYRPGDWTHYHTAALKYLLTTAIPRCSVEEALDIMRGLEAIQLQAISIGLTSQQVRLLNTPQAYAQFYLKLWSQNPALLEKVIIMNLHQPVTATGPDQGKSGLYFLLRDEGGLNLLIQNNPRFFWASLSASLNRPVTGAGPSQGGSPLYQLFYHAKNIKLLLLIQHSELSNFLSEITAEGLNRPVTAPGSHQGQSPLYQLLRHADSIELLAQHPKFLEKITAEGLNRAIIRLHPKKKAALARVLSSHAAGINLLAQSSELFEAVTVEDLNAAITAGGPEQLLREIRAVKILMNERHLSLAAAIDEVRAPAHRSLSDAAQSAAAMSAADDVVVPEQKESELAPLIPVAPAAIRGAVGGVQGMTFFTVAAEAKGIPDVDGSASADEVVMPVSYGAVPADDEDSSDESDKDGCVVNCCAVL